MNLTHAWLRRSQSRPPGEADLADPGLPKAQGLFDRADHHDLRCPIRQGDGSRGEGPKYTHRGRIVKTTGDGLLVDSPVLPMHCVVRPNGSAKWMSAVPLHRATIASSSGSAFTRAMISWSKSRRALL